MRPKPLHLFALIALLAAGLACATVSGGGITRDAERTAEAVQGDAEDVQAQAEETAAAVQATADALLEGIGNDNQNEDSGDNSNEDNGNDNGNDNENGNGITDLFNGEPPEDVPVLEGENEVLFMSEEIVSYFSEVDFDEVVAFYKEGMDENGWELDEDSALEVEGVALLTYNKDDRMASVSISVDPVRDLTAVLINITQK